MFGSFEDFLNENQRATTGGKLYSKFGQIIVMLGEAETEFSKNKGIVADLSLIGKAVAMKDTLAEKIKSDMNVDSRTFDLALAENVSVANILLENEYAQLPMHEVAAVKDLMLVTENHLPSLVFNIDRSELNGLVESLTKLGYQKQNMHVAFNMNAMEVNMSNTEKTIVESLSFDGTNASGVLSLAEGIELGDVYVAFNECKSSVDLAPLREMQIKRGSRPMKLHEMNRFVMDHLIVKESVASKYGLDLKQDNVPMLEGFKAYDFRSDKFGLQENAIFSRKDLRLEPLSAEAWTKLAHFKESYFTNGWKLEHTPKSIKLTNATDALRMDKVCENYHIELPENGYALIDAIHMIEMAGNKDWSCQGVANALAKLNGSITPDRQTVTAYVSESMGQRVFHPLMASKLREVTEKPNTVNDLLKVIANDQFKTFKVVGSSLNTKLDEADVNSIMKSVVERGAGVIVEGNNLSFEADGVKYSIEVDIK